MGSGLGPPACLAPGAGLEAVRAVCGLPGRGLLRERGALGGHGSAWWCGRGDWPGNLPAACGEVSEGCRAEPFGAVGVPARRVDGGGLRFAEPGGHGDAFAIGTLWPGHAFQCTGKRLSARMGGMRTGTPRISQSITVCGIRLRLSVPLGRGRTWASVGTRTGKGWTSVSAPVSRAQRGRNSR